MIKIPVTSQAAVPSTAAGEFRQSWRILLVAFVGAFFSGLPWATFTVFITPLSRAFGWSLAAISGLGTCFQIGSMISNPLVGRLADRVGVRLVALLSIPSLALALLGMSVIGPHIWMLYLAAFAIGCAGVSIAILIYGRAVNGWFVIGRGRAFSLMAAGVGISYIVGPRLVQAIADAWGWRNGFRSIAAVGLIVLPFVYFWLRERRDSVDRAARIPETGYTLGEAFKLPPFRFLAAAYLLMGLSNGAGLHLVPFLTAGGLTRAGAATYATVLGVASLLARLATGMMVDRIHAAVVCAFSVLAQALAFLLLGLFQVEYAVLAIFFWGFAQGAEIVCLGYCTARYFGLKSYGQVIGLINVFWGVGVGLGPVFFGWLRDLSGNYDLAFFVVAGLAVASAALLLLTGRHPFADLPPRPAISGAANLERVG